MKTHTHPINPADLPPNHELRNKPLREVGAFVRDRRFGRWLDTRDMRIGKSTFNELGKVWIDCNEWRIVL